MKATINLVNIKKGISISVMVCLAGCQHVTGTKEIKIKKGNICAGCEHPIPEML
jgi:hypothetical protein